MTHASNSLSDRHDTFTTPESTIFQLITAATGHTPINRQKLVKGYDNEVYHVETREGRSYILRIKRFGKTSMREEKWVIDQYRNAGVPVPVVVCVSTFTDHNDAREYMIQEKIIGVPLAEIKNQLKSDQVEDVYQHAGNMLRRLHTVHVDGFYKRHLDGSWDFLNWDSFANSNIVDRTKESIYLVQTGFFTENEARQMVEMVKALQDTFTCDQPVLCHGDYLEEHIFIDSAMNITGIIDFGMYRGDHPIHDFARLCMDSRSAHMDAFQKGYGDDPMFHDRFSLRLTLDVLSNQMGHATYYLNAGMKPESEHAIRALRKTFDRLRKRQY